MEINKSLLKLIHQRIENKKIIDSIKEKPLEESEIKDIILKSDLDTKTKTQFIGTISNLKKQGLAKDDYVPTFEEFSKNAEENKKYPIKASILKQMSSEQLHEFTSKAHAIYPDINTSSKVIHYRYKDTDGITRTTGEGIGVTHHNSQNNDIILEATKSFGKARDEINKILTDIQVRGNQFEDYRKEK